MRVRNEACAVFLPLEVVTREYAGKLLLALELANKGFQVIIGHKEPVKKLAVKALQPGVFFFKAVARENDSFFKTIRERGFVTVVQDEEAGIIYDDFAAFYEERRSLKRFGDHDAFFCWGPEDFNYLRSKHPESAAKLFMTGSPRSFLWGAAKSRLFYSENVEKFRRRHGSYILIASNLAGVSGARSEEEEIAWYQRTGYPAAAIAKLKQSMEGYRRLSDAYARLSREIHRTLGLNVVIRPHPSENSGWWKQKIMGMAGVYVETEGDLGSWIHGAEAVVQNGCTSAIESRMAGIPVFSFAECEEDIFSQSGTFANRVAKQAIGINALIELLANRREVWDCFLAETPDSVLERKIATPPQGAPRAIADVISSLATPLHIGHGIGHQGVDNFKKSSSVYLKNKRRPIVYEDVKFDVERASAALAITNQFYVEQCANNCFTITR